jgi:hypothetical protein
MVYRWGRRSVVLLAGGGLLVVGLVLLALPMVPGGTVVTITALALLGREVPWVRRLLHHLLTALARRGLRLKG